MHQYQVCGILCSLLLMVLLNRTVEGCPTINCLCRDISIIDCEYLDLRYMPDFDPENITYGILNLNRNRLKRIKSRAFHGLHIRDLTINMNSFALKIEVNGFKGLENDLEHLSISRSGVQIIPDGLFRNFPLLKSIDISDNQLRTLSSGNFKGSVQIQSINIANNELVNIEPATFTGTKLLQTLNLASNVIRIIDTNAFRGLKNLEELDLSENHIRDLQPKTFKVS